MNLSTVFSEDRVYRYTLFRQWDMFNDRLCNFICLNPSTADETVDDPTIRRCVGFAKHWGYGQFCMTNLFAFRATSPLVMKLQKDPFGKENFDWILRVAERAARVVIAWGSDGIYRGAGSNLRQRLQEYRIRFDHLGCNQNGEPKHPLYLPKTAVPIQWGLTTGKTSAQSEA